MYQQYRPTGFNILPLVVKNLMIINGLFFLATMMMGENLGINLTRILGLHYFSSEYFAPHQYVTHLFMHGSMGHIFSNMFALWMFGSMLENVWGPKRFLLFYLVTGLGAALLHTLILHYEISAVGTVIESYAANPSFENFDALLNKYPALIDRELAIQLNHLLQQWQFAPGRESYIQESVKMAWELFKNKTDVPTVGASGAVFGVLLGFGMLFPNTYIYLYMIVPIKAKYLVLLYGLFELYSGFQNDPSDNVAHFAHIGGMIFGYFLIRYWNRSNRRTFY